ncbi:MAG: ribulose-phosphate 3-epimerase [Acetobacteraceae bacterium]|nr:ribulose-phosphate 3-epimerase [Acetobacteraceae bacterium]
MGQPSPRPRSTGGGNPASCNAALPHPRGAPKLQWSSWKAPRTVAVRNEAQASAPLIAPSLLAADFSRLGEEIGAVERAGADWLHLDIMDGHFVPNISFGPGLVKALRKHCGLPFDVHLMIAPADPYLAAFAEAGADLISLHPEAGPHLHRSLQTIQALGKKAGVVLNPATPVESIAHVMDLLDLILVMTVNPGFGGQSFLASQLRKIATLRQMITASGRPIHLQVDGGVTAATAPACLEAGADVLVAGTAVFGSADYAAAIAGLRGGR